MRADRPDEPRRADPERREGSAWTTVDLETIRQAISHELRAPLRAIVGFTQILSESHAHALDADGRLCLDHVVHAGRRMEELCGALLDYLHLGRARVRCEPVPLERVLARIGRDLGPRIEAAGGRLVVEPGLPAPLGDENLIETVFTVLIGNALDYRRPGTPARIEVTGVVQSDRVAIAVADNGTGIAGRDLEKIFRPFQRLVADDVVPGIGIGLALARKAVELQRGSIEVESTPGAGSRFSVLLPHAPIETSAARVPGNTRGG